MNKLKIFMLFVFMILLGFSGYKIFTTQKEISESNKIKEELIELVDIPVELEKQEDFVVDFEELKQINNDIVGWIVVEGTQINYPIVKGTDNDFYLNHSFDKEWNSLGSIFMDYRSLSDFSGYNTFIYGHHTKNGSMFGELYKYMNVNFYNEYPSFYLYTEFKKFRVEIFSAYTDDAESDSYNQSFSNQEEFINYIDLIINKSNYKTNVVIENTDKIISLYSCSHESNRKKTDRYFIHGKLIEI